MAAAMICRICGLRISGATCAGAAGRGDHPEGHMPSCLTDYELVTQSVDLTSGTPSSIVDLAVPSGKIVLGSGIVVTHVWHSGALTAIASVSDWGPTEARD